MKLAFEKSSTSVGVKTLKTRFLVKVPSVLVCWVGLKACKQVSDSFGTQKRPKTFRKRGKILLAPRGVRTRDLEVGKKSYPYTPVLQTVRPWRNSI